MQGTVIRTPDWDNPKALAHADHTVGNMMAMRFVVEPDKTGHYRLVRVRLGFRNPITNFMSVAELRAFVEGMRVGI